MPLGLGDDGEVAQAEEVHLQHAEQLEIVHRVLGGDGFMVHAQGHELADRARRDHDAGGVGGGVARHPFDLFRHRDQAGGLRIRAHQLRQFRHAGQRAVERHVRRLRDHFGHAVRRTVGDAHRPRHVAHRRARRHRAERDDLRHVIRAVARDNVIDDALPPFGAEIHVEVRHTYPLRVEEAFEQQIVFDRVDRRDAHAVRTQAARAGAAPRPDGDAVLLGVAHIFRHDQKVIGIAHLPHDVQLMLQPRGHGRSRRVAVQAAQPVAAQPLHIRIAVAARRIEPRQLQRAERDRQAAALRDPDGVLHRLRQRREQRRHLIAGLEPELLGREGERARLVERGAGLDAAQHPLHLRIVLFQIMHVVGAHQRQPRFLRKAHQTGVDGLLLLEAVILQLQIKMLRPEGVGIPACGLLRAGLVLPQQATRDLARQAGGQRDQPVVIAGEQLPVDARAAVEPFRPCAADQLQQVTVARFVLAQQHEVGIAVVRAVHLIAAPARRDVHLAPDDRADALFFTFAVKIDRAVQHAVIRDRQRRLAQRLRAGNEGGQPARPVEQAVFAVDVQMHEIGHGGSSFPVFSRPAVPRRFSAAAAADG